MGGFWACYINAELASQRIEFDSLEAGHEFLQRGVREKKFLTGLGVVQPDGHLHWYNKAGEPEVSVTSNGYILGMYVPAT